VAMGLAISSRTATIWPGGPAAMSVHRFVSVLSLMFVAFHAFILLGDEFMRYTVFDIAVPFAAEQYEHTWVGVGQSAFYVGGLVTVSSYLRNRIGYRAWRLLHYLTLAMFGMALAHGVLVGSDTEMQAVRYLYYVTGGLALFALIYRIMVSKGGASPAAVPVSAVPTASAKGGELTATLLPEGTTAPIAPGRTLLDVARACGLKVPTGCGAGMCGVDPLYIAEGAEHLSSVRGDEKATLARLGLPPGWRLACSATVHGSICFGREQVEHVGQSTTPATPAALGFEPDRAVRNIVVIGNGVAGNTAAADLRRYLPEAAITIVSKEPRHFYNRMALAQLIEGQATPGQLTLSSADWYDDRRIECLLGAEAVDIDRVRRVVITDRGRYLEYDRLLLAGGSDSTVPLIEGWGLAGCFTLRDIDDAMAIRDYVRFQGCRNAYVLGGGLLGMEAAHSLRKIGLDTTIIDRNPRLMHRQTDHDCGDLLNHILDSLGIRVRLNTNVRSVAGDGRVRSITLEDGRVFDCDVLLASTGISPGVGLARNAGLDTARGVLVDDRLRTSDPRIFAAGDIAEHRGAVYGLWAASADQARVAARNMAGAEESYHGSESAAQLKLFGVDLVSFGSLDSRPGDEVFAEKDVANRQYRKVVVREGRLVGAVLLGHPDLVPALAAAVSGDGTWRPLVNEGRLARA
jgi:NADPH-dependent 2,4-dienoyl-CoA reductase/sulfur reductase-like enzyme/ferredoxin